MAEKDKALILLVFFILIITAVIVAALFPGITGLTTKETGNESSSVKMGTFAVCEKKDNLTYCQDKVFASCNKTPVEINSSSFECNGKIYDIANTTLGEAYHPINWTDPRSEDCITAWAIAE